MEAKNKTFFKQNKNDVIWWLDTFDQEGVWVFSFDKKKTYNLFADYPYKMTKTEIEIFDKENPFWAEYFSDRKKEKK